jgi:hypothetical protein
MTTEVILKYSDVAFVAICLGIVVIMARKHLVREFPLLAALLSIQAIGESITIAILFFRQSLGIEIHAAYKVFFYSHWLSLAIECVLRILIIYSVFSLAMKPLQGLHQIGKVIFRWVAAVSVMVSGAIAIGPHFVSSGYSTTMVITRLTEQIEQGISVLTLCLLLFVCFSTKPLGLTYRSRLFGITLGLGVMATVSLILSAWFSSTGAHSLYSPIYLFGAVGSTAALSIWAVYFILPEPERKLILLPTTSPFFFWNKISEALGDNPGHVAIAGFRPDMLAPAEMQMLSAPSMRRLEQPLDISLPAMPAMLQTATSR